MESGGKKQKGSVLNNAERLHVPRQATGRERAGCGMALTTLTDLTCEHAVCKYKLRFVFLSTNLIPSNNSTSLKSSVSAFKHYE